MSDIEHEIEAKIYVSAEVMQNVFDVLSVDAEGGKIKNKHRPRAYFDTKSRKISKAKMALRVQYKEGVGYEQTLKYEDAAEIDRKMSRIEVKNVLGEKNKQPDLSLIDLSVIQDKKVREQIKEISSKKLEHVFTASVKRQYFTMPVIEDGKEIGKEIGKVELAFDAGQVVHAVEQGLSEIISEIEVELKSGDSSAVDIMCKRILDMAPESKLSSVSKAETGYRLDDKARDRKEKSKDVSKSLASECKDLTKKSRSMLPPK